MEGRFRHYSKVVSLEIRESGFKYYMLTFRSVLLIILLYAYIIQYAQKALMKTGVVKNFQNYIKAIPIFFLIYKNVIFAMNCRH